MPDPLPLIAIVQGVYFLATGAWPIVSIRTFMAVTGPKHDLWLVRTVGVVVGVIGGVLLLTGLRDTVDLETLTLALAAAAGLATIDVVYVARGTIDRIYLLDAAAEAALMVAWLVAWRW